MSATFARVELTELKDEGVLLAANENFFWPLGLALGWSVDAGTGEARDLHVRQWELEDGHVESIGSTDDDPVYAERRARWQAWATARVMRFPPGPEQDRAAMVASIVPAFLGPTPTADEGDA